jgi:hypothetical protein
MRRSYRVVVVPQATIGTDPAQSRVLAEREIDMSEFGFTGAVCGIVKGQRQVVEVMSEPGRRSLLPLA